MKRDMKGKRFSDVAKVKKKTTEALSSVTTDEFKKRFEQWSKRLDKCISSNGEYFEGNQKLFCKKSEQIIFLKISSVSFGYPLRM